MRKEFKSYMGYGIFFIFLSMIVMGCSQKAQQFALTSGELAVEVNAFESQYKKVEELMRVKQAKEQLFTDEEWRTLLNVDATIDLLLLKTKAVVQLNPESLSMSDAKLMYDLARVGYDEAYKVIQSKWSPFLPSTQIILSSLDGQARYMDEKVQELLSDDNADITQAIALVTGMLGLAVKMIGLVVL